MGEIYRSVSVSGTRTLLAQRAERIANERKEKESIAGKPSKQTGKPASLEQAKPNRDYAQADLPDKAAVTAESISEIDPVTDSLLQSDLFDIQQKRLVQLEQEKQDLEELLKAQEDELQQARAELQAWIAAEETKGYKDGYKKALAEANKNRQEKISELQQVMTLFGDTLRSQVEQVDRYAVEIAFAALGRIIGEQYASAEFSKAIVTEALAAVRDSSKVVVRISQKDYEILKGIEGDLASGGQFSDFQLVADPRVGVGGCLIETDNGAWDARLETQLSRLKVSVEQSFKKQQ